MAVKKIDLDAAKRLLAETEATLKAARAAEKLNSSKIAQWCQVAQAAAISGGRKNAWCEKIFRQHERLIKEAVSLGVQAELASTNVSHARKLVASLRAIK